MYGSVPTCRSISPDLPLGARGLVVFASRPCCTLFLFPACSSGAWAAKLALPHPSSLRSFIPSSITLKLPIIIFIMFSVGVSTLLALLTALPFSLQASADDWRSRAIYQVVTDRFARTDGSTTAPCDPAEGEYCGGTWQGLVKQLDYIQGMGFSAIWISPVTLNLMQTTVDLQSYHGYWQQNLYELNPKFGTVNDLKALGNALHSRSMYLMVDVVVGNVAFAGSPSSVDYSTFDPFNSQQYFHQYCAMTDANNLTEVRDVSHCSTPNLGARSRVPSAG